MPVNSAYHPKPEPKHKLKKTRKEIKGARLCANAAWLAAQVMAHNLACWSAQPG